MPILHHICSTHQSDLYSMVKSTTLPHPFKVLPK